MPGLLDDIWRLNAPAVGDVPVGEYIDYTVMPERAKRKTAMVGLLGFLPIALAVLFVFFVLRGRK
jgi:hypothetical protein